MKKQFFVGLLIFVISTMHYAQGAPVDPDGNWTGLNYKTRSNIETILKVVTIGSKTYLVSRDIFFGGKRAGMMQRVFADGTVQFEEWEDGKLMQTGLRGPYETTIAPQTRQRAAPQSSAVAQQSSAVAPAGINLNGEWIGKNSGNRVRQEVRPGGVLVSPVTQNAGQSANGFLYSGSGKTYRFTFPGGDSVMEVLGPDQFRVTNSDGWTDVFTRPR